MRTDSTPTIADPAIPAPSHPVDDPNHITRQEAARLACVAAGIDWPSTILPEGTALYTSGLEKLRSDRARWRALPVASEALPVIGAALAAEDRQDWSYDVSTLRLREDNGRIATEFSYQAPVKAKPGLGYTAHSFRQLVQAVPGLAAGEAPRGMAGALLYLTDQERAGIINARIGEARGGQALTLRTKVVHSGARVTRACLSSRYADCQDVHVAEAIRGALNGRGSTAKIDYKPGDGQSRFEIIFPSEVPIRTFRVGDVHYATIQIRNSETGEGSLLVRPAVLRAACANLTLSTGEGVATRMVHAGSGENLRNKLKAALLAAEAQLAPLVAAIQRSAETPLDYTPGDLIEKLARALDLEAARARDWRETLEGRYLPTAGNTVWSLASAVTEAAQRAPNWIAQEREEAVAARITAENGIAWIWGRGRTVDVTDVDAVPV